MRWPSLSRPGRHIPTVLPWAAELPVLREHPGFAAELGELLAECFRLGKVDIAHGKVVTAGNSAVSSPGSFPTTRFHCPCVVSNLAIQKPLVNVTST